MSLFEALYSFRRRNAEPLWLCAAVNPRIAYRHSGAQFPTSDFLEQVAEEPV